MPDRLFEQSIMLALRASIYRTDATPKLPLFSLLPLIGYAIFVQSKLKLTAAHSLVFVISAWTLILFFGGLADLLYPIAAVTWIGGAAVGLLILVRDGNTRSHIHEPVYLILILACLAFWSIHHASYFAYFDEFSHWGIYIREMWSQAAIWGAETNAVRPRYLPGASLWQYAFTVFTPNVESAAYLAQFVLLICPLLVMFDNMHHRQSHWMLFAILLVTIGLINYSHGIVSLYVDHVISTWIFGIAVLIIRSFQSDKQTLSEYLLLSVPIALLALIKSSAVAFAAALICIAILLQFFRNRTKLPGLAVLLMPMLIVVSVWTLNRNTISAPAYTPHGCLATCIEQQISGSEPLQEILSDLVRGGIPEEPRTETVTSQFLSVFTNHRLKKTEADRPYNEFLVERLDSPEHPLGLTTSRFLLLFSVFFAVLFAVVRQRSFLVNWGSFALGMVVTAIGYSTSLWLAYLFFYEDAGHRIPSYHRFIHTISLPMYLLMIAVLMPGVGPEKLHKKLAGNLSAAGILISLLTVYMLVVERPDPGRLIDKQPPSNKRSMLEPSMLGLRDVFGPSRILVLMPANPMPDMRDQIMLYLLTPTPASFYRGNGLLELSDNALYAELRNIDYIWLPEVYDKFDREVENRIGRIGALRMIRVNHKAQPRYSPVDRDDQLPPVKQ